jgi:predicted cation transporter
LIILGALAGLEVAILYVLIAVDTPLAPAVRRLVETPAGLFVVVMGVVGVLIVGMWGFTSWAEWYHRAHGGTGDGAREPEESRGA